VWPESKNGLDGYNVVVEDLVHEGNGFGGGDLRLHQFGSAFLRQVALDLNE